MIKTLLITILLSTSLTCQIYSQNYKVVSERQLKSDGPAGIETYELIKSILDPNPIEVPDLYIGNHPGVKHINHFSFLIHRNIDKDRDTDNTDCQRDEIKAYDASEYAIKGFKGESMRYHWYFGLDKDFSISRNFSHFFQLKAVGGSYSSQPVVTISGSINSGEPQFEVMHSSLTGNENEQLVHTTWDKANHGERMKMEVLTTIPTKAI